MTPGSAAIAPADAAAANHGANTKADNLARTISGYYDHLQAKAPVYANLDEPALLPSVPEHDIQGQLGALADRIKFLLAQGDSRLLQPCSAHLDRFMENILHRGQAGKLSTEQAQYFYSNAFKGGLEQQVVEADMAPPQERRVAIRKLEALCELMGAPISFFNQVVGAAMIHEYATRFADAVGR
jgi:hypothetical protein